MGGMRLGHNSLKPRMHYCLTFLMLCIKCVFVYTVVSGQAAELGVGDPAQATSVS